MNQVFTFRLFITSFIVCCFASTIAFAQLEPAPKLPEGMKGSDMNDPRAKLKPGLYDAGEAAFGMKHLSLLKKPEAFQLGSDDANSPQVKKILQSLGVPEAAVSTIPEASRLIFAQLAFANTDFAFQGNHLFQGNFYGVSIYDISNPADTKILTSIVCPGGQGDVSVFKNLLFMSVEMPNGHVGCSSEGFPPQMPQPGQAPKPDVQKDRFRGVRIFDISDVKSPKQVGLVQTCRGSHTHTVVEDPKDKENIYVYVSGTSFVRPGEELFGCSSGLPAANPNTALFSIDVIKVPLAQPEEAKIVSSPRVFMDSRTGVINGLNNGGSHERNQPSDTDQCHDITVYSEIGLAAGACSGNGILLDIRDPANPKRIDAVNDKNYAYWHSATFSNDGKKVVFTDEWGGGMGARCRENDPNVWGANAIFNIKDSKLEFASYYKIPAAQSDSENCVAHNGSLIPVAGRDIKVQSWYQGGISIMDFTDSAKPFEIGYFDRGPIFEKILVLGGDWSAYWYNGYIYGSEIARGLDILELTPTKFLTQNEIDLAKSIKVAELNVQDQKMIVYPKNLLEAKVYVDQLERSNSLSAKQITDLRKGIQKAESSKLNKKDANNLKKFVPALEKNVASAKSEADSNRLKSLAEILKQPIL